MLKILVHFKHCQHIDTLWDDIEQIHRKNTVSSPSIMKCLVLSDHSDKMSRSIQVLQWMIDCKYSLKHYEWNDFSLSISKLITFCADSNKLSSVRTIHQMINRLKIEDLFIQTAMINAYGALSDIECALDVFHSVSTNKKDVVITGCIVRNGRPEEAKCYQA